MLVSISLVPSAVMLCASEYIVRHPLGEVVCYRLVFGKTACCLDLAGHLA